MTGLFKLSLLKTTKEAMVYKEYGCSYDVNRLCNNTVIDMKRSIQKLSETVFPIRVSLSMF